MSILVVGVNHRSGPLALLERVTISPDHLAKAVSGLAQRDNVREAVVLSTCNRTEVYVVAELFHGAYGDVRDLLCELGDLGVDELTPHLYSQHDTAAVTHLFEVAAGLDSAVLGESEILGQVRTAWDVAQREGASRSTLNQLFRSALATGKRARSETGIARGTASISHAAVEMISDVVGELSGRRVLVVGAGSMGEGVAVALRRARWRRDSGRQPDVRSRLGTCRAGRGCGRRVRSPPRGRRRCRRDHRRYRSGPSGAHSFAGGRRACGASSSRPLHIVDIGVPRNVDPSVAELAGVTLADLDDLRDWADRGLSHRAAEAERVRVIVSEEVEQFLVDSTARQAAPLVASMHGAAERVRLAELERFAARLGDLDDAQRDALDSLTKAIIAKLLHEPSVRLKGQAGTPQGERNAAAMRDLFDLG